MICEAINAAVVGGLLPIYDAMRPVVGPVPAFIVTVATPCVGIMLLVRWAEYLDRRNACRF